MGDIVQTFVTWFTILGGLFIVGASLLVLFQAGRTIVAGRNFNLQTIIVVGFALLTLPVAVALYPPYMLTKATEGLNSVTAGMPAFVDGVLTLVDVAQTEAGERSAETVPSPLPTEFVIMQMPTPEPTVTVEPTPAPTLPAMPTSTPQPTPCFFVLNDGRSLPCPPTPVPSR